MVRKIELCLVYEKHPIAPMQVKSIADLCVGYKSVSMKVYEVISKYHDTFQNRVKVI